MWLKLMVIGNGNDLIPSHQIPMLHCHIPEPKGTIYACLYGQINLVQHFVQVSDENHHVSLLTWTKASMGEGSLWPTNHQPVPHLSWDSTSKLMLTWMILQCLTRCIWTVKTCLLSLHCQGTENQLGPMDPSDRRNLPDFCFSFIVFY